MWMLGAAAFYPKSPAAKAIAAPAGPRRRQWPIYLAALRAESDLLNTSGIGLAESDSDVDVLL
jgi:hypothetical protein